MASDVEALTKNIYIYILISLQNNNNKIPHFSYEFLSILHEHLTVQEWLEFNVNLLY